MGGLLSKSPPSSESSSSSSPSSSSSSSTPAVPLRELIDIPRSDLRHPSDEENARYPVAGSFETRKYHNRMVVIKVVPVPSHSDFKNEITALSQGIQHPNIVEIIGVCRGEGSSMMIVEYVEGNNLEKVLLSSIPLSWETVLNYAIQICSAMAHVHQHNVVHRNLKPSNVIILKSPKPGVDLKLLDFGMARLVAGSMTSKKGTLQYCSPEMLKAAGPGHFTTAVDIYSFGIFLWQLITRREPLIELQIFELPKAVIAGTRPKIPAKMPDILRHLIEALWADNPRNRPPFQHAKIELEKALGMVREFPDISTMRN